MFDERQNMSMNNGLMPSPRHSANDVPRRHRRLGEANLYDRVSRLDPAVRKQSMLATLAALSNSDGRKDKRRSRRSTSLREAVQEKVASSKSRSRTDNEANIHDANQNARRKVSTGGLTTIFRFRKQLRTKAQNIRRRKLHTLFRALAKVTIILHRMCEMHYQIVSRDTKKNLTFSQLDVTPADDLMFDVTQYKANKELRISKEAKQILSKPPKDRTEQEIYLVTIALRNLKSIAEYPVRMQRRVASVGWFESYESKRALVREGHVPLAFYFLLSGSVVVTIMDREKSQSQTVAILKRGDSFGELAILNRSRRTSSVTSREFIELLCISAEDFTSIFMSGGIKTLNDPDHSSFVGGINFLRGWPLELLEENPKMCIFNYFKSGTVLVRDSKQSDWIYIVKSGSCSVLKKLKQVKPNIKQQLQRRARDLPQDESVGPDNDTSHTALLEEKAAELVDKRRNEQKRSILSKYVMPLISTNLEADESGLGNSRAPSAVTIDRIGEGQILQTPSENLMLQHESKRYLSGIRRRLSALDYLDFGDDDIIDEEEEENDEPVTQTTFAAGPFLSRTLKRLEIDELAEKKKWDKMSTLTGLSSEDEYLVQGNQRTITYDLNYGYQQNEAESDSKPTFVRVQTLVKGAVFGLAEMLFENQPSLSLVSNGAECIVISKKFFMEHANEDLMTRLRMEERPYITDEEMQNNLEKQLNWDVYRKMTMRRAALAVKQRKANRRDFKKLGISI
ncbi:cGMP-dependent protein kinase-like [Ptychodera flava]|uniref:cGMP-dependent protein kinase-like n=1 Tax=Ptychodera flava TaxID=63121 RepID=UPI00396AAC39